MNVETLVIGGRYLIGLPPFRVKTIVYLGPIPGWPTWCRVRGLMERKVTWVKTAALRPLLVTVGGER